MSFSPEHKLLLALSAVLKPSYPHLEELHADVERSAERHAELAPATIMPAPEAPSSTAPTTTAPAEPKPGDD